VDRKQDRNLNSLFGEKIPCSLVKIPWRAIQSAVG
jgi:hypothetical protein